MGSGRNGGGRARPARARAAAFFFTIVTTLALVFSPERRFRNPLLLKALVLLNVCASCLVCRAALDSLDHAR